jgi:NitT/TauT family transport system ATP-binding protein
LLDEPFASVDAHVRLELEDLVSQLVRTSGVTTILVTHDVDEAIYLADRVITLTGSPARVGLSLDVDLLRPRTQTSTRGEKRFSELRNALYIGLRKPEVK